MSLTPEEVNAIADAIHSRGLVCPHGMTPEDIVALRAFIRWWDNTKDTAWKVVVRIMVTVLLAALGWGLIDRIKDMVQK